MAFGETLKRLREDHSVTQSELATVLGLAKSTISMYEQNKRRPSYEIMEAIADFFNVDMNTLYGSDKNTVPENTIIPDIQDRLEELMSQISPNAGLAFLNGDEPMDDETKELMYESLKNALRLSKLMAERKKSDD